MNSTFCTDLVSLFVNHIFDCDSCFDKTIVLAVLFFGFFAFLFILISILVDLFGKLFSKIFDRFRYKKSYDDISSLYVSLLEKHEDLLRQYDELEKEYYHTCN